MSAINETLKVERGASFDIAFQLLQADGVTPRTGLTGYVATMQVRPDVADTGTPILALTPTFDDVTATITVHLNVSDTEKLTDTEYVYGIELAAPGNEPTERIAQGTVLVSDEVVK